MSQAIGNQRVLKFPSSGWDMFVGLCMAQDLNKSVSYISDIFVLGDFASRITCFSHVDT